MKKTFFITITVIIILILIGSAVWFYFLVAARKETLKPKEEINAFTFYNWWTSPGESAALNSLISLFSKKYPNTAVMPTSIVGGAGYTLQGIIKNQIFTGYPPDTFQMHAGYEGKTYYDAGLLLPVDDIWQSEGLEKVVPSVIQDMSKFDGHYYSVPLDIHRVNLIWYNKSILDKYSINADNLESWENFFRACDKLRESGMEYPIRMGESWTAAHVFEQIVASEGIDFYQDWVNGKVLSAYDPSLIHALSTFEKYLSYVNPDHSVLSWNEAVGGVIKGDGAFSVMGDWANQEFKIARMKYGVDYGAMKVPGTKEIYGLSIDTFQRPKNISHAINADRWLKLIASKEGQDTFNPLKGSIPARTDIDIAEYDDYQQLAISDFWKARNMFPSVVYGSGAPGDFKLKLEKTISGFMIDLDKDKAARDLTAYTALINSEYTINWSLK